MNTDTENQSQNPATALATGELRRREIQHTIPTLGISPGVTIDQIYLALHHVLPELVIGIGGQEKARIHKILKKMGYIIHKGIVTAIPHPNGEVTIQRMVRTIEGQARRIRELEDEVRHWQKEAHRNHPGRVSQIALRAMATYGEVD